MAQQPLRKAVQTAIGEGEMLAAGFGDTRFFIVEGNHFPKGTPFYSDAGTDRLQRARRRRRPRARPSRPATRASRCASSPAASTTSTTTWR